MAEKPPEHAETAPDPEEDDLDDLDGKSNGCTARQNWYSKLMIRDFRCAR